MAQFQSGKNAFKETETVMKNSWHIEKVLFYDFFYALSPKTKSWCILSPSLKSSFGVWAVCSYTFLTSLKQNKKGVNCYINPPELLDLGAYS